MNEWRDGSLIPSECSQCKVFGRCGGECRISAIKNCEKDPIMNEEELHPEVVLREPTPVRIFPTTNIRIRSICRFRKDNAMGIINTGGVKNTFLHHETFDLLKKLHNKKVTFTSESLIENYDVRMKQEACAAFLSELVERDVAEILP